MNLTGIDLNLLVALDALLLETNVSRAALRIGLSQPAASHALQRLRALFSDPLLVRVGARMELTPRAQGLRAPLAEALDQVRGLLRRDGFDAARSERRFRLMIPDLIAELLVPPLVQHIGEAAPGVRLVIVPWRSQFDMTAEFSRSLDLAISYLSDDYTDAYPGFHRALLFEDSDALAVRRDHPLRKRLTSTKAFFQARHISIVGRGQRDDPIDRWLRAKRMEREVVLTVPGYIEALHIVSRTDLVAFVPRRLIAATAKALSLIAVKPPLDPGVDRQYMFHPTRAHVDPGSIWLRKLVLEIAQALPKP
jgi:DNA-binding transcriptional LysR family regulator